MLLQLHPPLLCSLTRGALHHLPRVGGTTVGAMSNISRSSLATNTFRKRLAETKRTAALRKEIQLPPMITARELASRMSVRVVDVLKVMIRMGEKPKTANEILPVDLAELILMEKHYAWKRVEERTIDVLPAPEYDDQALYPHHKFVPRPPIVTIMGHVDHGKTTLLDSLRMTSVAEKEAGGITQHVGAFSVSLDSGSKITFLDTPGHAAFSSMRERGAQLTDMIVLVISGEDSIRPQTIEVIKHAEKTEVPLIIAINKCDKPSARPQKVREDLVEHGVLTEPYGGDTQSVEISALKKIGLDKLEEAIMLQSQFLNLMANISCPPEAIVVESRISANQGPLCVAIVKRGILKPGMIVVAGEHYGRIRSLKTHDGKQLREVTPGMPVEVMGLKGSPSPGDYVICVPSEERAKEISEYRIRKAHEAKEQKLARKHLVRSEEEQEIIPTLPLLIKADVAGSLEAITSTLDYFPDNQVRLKVLDASVGVVSESDVLMAGAAKASILAFNTRVHADVTALAKQNSVPIHPYRIIYQLFDGVRDLMSSLLPPITMHTVIGEAEVQQIFEINVKKKDPPVVKIAGCRVATGRLKRTEKFRVVRDGQILFTGSADSLRHMKDNVSEVKAGTECGLCLDGFSDLRAGDRIQCVTEHTQKQTIPEITPEFIEKQRREIGYRQMASESKN
eukprot:TRINITY_DN6393_c0_g1_i1.p1 TRINITY_DN6393_c0_g1~~TRINITY_DN6393_c0_g1_i1.p1  ORF type:complete len:679 (-),score=167.73 TRINITY_DN6393_c0_g1_i1:474-2510(-)